jgi:hypothetical protein
MDELKLTNLDIDKPPTSDIRDNSDDVVVPDSMNDGWTEVSSRHSVSSSGSIKGVHLLAPDSILTSNRYEPLIDLSDTLERVDNTTKPGKQVTVNNRITNEVSQIPTIINGVIHSSESEKSLKYGSDRTRKTQPLNSGTPSVLILSDSHLRGCTTMINNGLGNLFRTNGWIKSGAPAKDILNIPNSEVANMNLHDVIVLCAGANDVYRNNSSVAIRKITKFVMNNRGTNIIIIGVPHRYDLSEQSCVNNAIQSFNSKLKKITTMFSYVTVIESIHGKEHFTSHGLHYNRRGKILITKQVVSEISKVTARKGTIPIRLGWLMNTEQVGPISFVNPVEELRNIEEFTTESQETVDSQTVVSQNNETSGPTLTKIVTNEPILGVEISDSSNNSTKTKRLRKTPCTRSKDFLW